MLKRVQQDQPVASYERFIKPLSPTSIDGSVVLISVPGKFVLEWVKDRFLATLQSLLSDEIGFPITIELKSEPRERPVVTGAAAVPLPPEATTFHPNEKYSFETYVVGQSNRLAVAGAKAVADRPGDVYNPLFMYGSSGLGKTHLLHSIAREIRKRDPKYPLVFVTAQQFAEEFVNALQANRIDQFRRNQRNVGMWLVDDIQFIAGKDKTQEEIFHTFNYLHSLGKQIVLTSDRPPRDLHLMDERLRSRFEAGLVADVQMPDTETRCAILLSKAQQEKIVLEHEIAMYLAENVPGNIRALEGALNKMVASASLEQAGISLGLAEKLVEQYYSAGVLAKPSVDQILGVVGKHFKISLDEIKGNSRKAPIVHARHIAIFITRELTGDSWKHIGGMFGDRDHTSMMHGYQKISEMMAHDKDFTNVVKKLIHTLHPDAR